jgi:hypothetical protein
VNIILVDVRLLHVLLVEIMLVDVMLVDVWQLMAALPAGRAPWTTMTVARETTTTSVPSPALSNVSSSLQQGLLSTPIKIEEKQF